MDAGRIVPPLISAWHAHLGAHCAHAVLSPAFIAAYARVDAEFAATAPGRPSLTARGSVDAHISRYLTGHDFGALGANTQKSRRNLLCRFAEMELNGRRVGDLPTNGMQKGHIRKLTADLAPQSKHVMVIGGARSL
jgi:hypothetical protein